MAVRYDGDKKTILLACEKAGLSMSDFIVGASLKTRNVGVKNEPKTFLNLKKERAMNEKYTDYTITINTAKNRTLPFGHINKP